jgi:hypothetical protein
VLPDDYTVVQSDDFPYPVIVDNTGVEISTPVWLQWAAGRELPASALAFVETARAFLGLA